MGSKSRRRSGGGNHLKAAIPDNTVCHSPKGCIWTEEEKKRKKNPDNKGENEKISSNLGNAELEKRQRVN